jgi:hypothetical protein
LRPNNLSGDEQAQLLYLFGHLGMNPQGKPNRVEHLLVGRESGGFEPCAMRSCDPLSGAVEGIRGGVRAGGSVPQQRRQLDQVEDA